MKPVFERAAHAYDWRGDLEKAETFEDLRQILQQFFGVEVPDEDELTHEAAISAVLAQINDPVIRKCIDEGIRKELTALKDKYAKDAISTAVRKLEKGEIELPPHMEAAQTTLFIPGREKAEEACYEVIEADEAQASHLPESGFERNPRYTLENERLYHKEAASQAKVLNNAARLTPDFLLRDSVDANNGAPVLDQDGNVLGGNSRVMSLRVAYQKGGKQIERYRDALKKRARELGISVRRIEAMKQPVLVRRLVTPYTKEERQRLVGDLNSTYTDSKDSRAAGKTRGTRLTKKTLMALGAGLQKASTLREFFDDPDSAKVVEQLVTDGVIQVTERNSMLTVDGLLNPYGKTAVEEALRGRIVKSYETLARLPGRMVSNLDRIAPFVIVAETIGGDWNITPFVSEAVDMLVEYKGSTFSRENDYCGFMNTVGVLTGKTPLERYSKIAAQLFTLILNSKPLGLADRFRKYAMDAAEYSQDANAFSFLQVSAKDSAKKRLGIDLADNVMESAMMNLVFERATPGYDWNADLEQATTLDDLTKILKKFFGNELPPDPEEYKDEGSDYGLKIRGKKAREGLNARCREILARVTNPADLTPEDRATLLQYSGRGGTSDNSQFEYYTPTPLAEGIWETLAAHGFENGNVLEPACGAGVFLGTKPAGVVMTATDIDETSSGVARLLNPEDHVATGAFENIVMAAGDDSFDSCVGNVPFGGRDDSIALDPAYKKEKSLERYFLLRVLDKIKPGGLACLVVPTTVIGAKQAIWKKFRMEVSRRAEFLGAHKLPSGYFAAQGTDTVVDVIVLRKHGRDLLGKLREDLLPTETLKAAKVYWEEFIDGKYWLGEGRPFIMGRYVPKDAKDRFSRERVEGKVDDISLKRALAKKFHSRIDWELLQEAEPVLRNYVEGDRRIINEDTYEFSGGGWVKVTLVVENSAIDKELFGAGTTEELEGLLAGPESALRLNAKQAAAILEAYPHLMKGALKDAITFAKRQIPALREQAWRGSLLGSMLAKMGTAQEAGEETGLMRAHLQELVTAEISKYGLPAKNRGFVVSGEEARAFGVFMNSVDKKGNFSDLLGGTLNKERAKGYEETDLPSVVSFLHQQNDDQVELEDVRALYKGTIPLESLADVAEAEELAVTPDGMIETMADYCTGDLPAKMAELRNAMATCDDERLRIKFQKQIDRMNRLIRRTPPENITFGLQQKWFDKKYILEFLHQNGYPDATFGSYKEVDVEDYDGEIRKREGFVEDTNDPAGHFFLGRNAGDGYSKQLEKYLNGENVTSSKKELKTEYLKRVADHESMFDGFMKQHVDADDLCEQYAMKFNGFVQKTYSEAPLGIEDMLSGEIAPHAYQNAEVRRLSEQGSGICGFGVGLGKSFTALAMAAYNKKKGKANRTCLVVPDAVLENWYHEAKTFYSEAYMRENVFFVGLEPVRDKKTGAVMQRPVLDETGQPKKRKDGQDMVQDVVRFTKSKEDIHAAMWKIPQSNFSLVVMTKDKFKTIPVRPETMRAYTDDMVQRGLMSDKEAASLAGQKEKKGKSYAEDVRLNALRREHSNTGGEKKTELPYLEDMGFDSIVTDESHFYKNSIKKGTKTGDVKGVPGVAKPSDIAVDMAIKCAWLRKRQNGRGVYGLTATPVTNSPAEIYNMLSLVCPKEEFERMGVHTVDDFIRVFGKIEERDRAKVSGEVVKALTLIGFQNLDGLRNLFHRYVNVKTVEDVDNQIHVPNAVEKEDETEMSVAQKELYAGLQAEAVKMSRQGRSETSGRSIFSIMRDMEKVSTDLDLYTGQMTFVLDAAHEEKVRRIADGLPTRIHIDTVDEATGEKITSTLEFEATVKKSGAALRLIVHASMEEQVLKALAEAGISENEVTHPVSPKYARLLANCKSHLDMNGKQIVFTEEKTQHQKLKRILVHNLPIEAAQVGIINAEAAEGAKLDAISKAYNAGAIKIVIANKKAEVGVNLQKGTTAIHHLTLPWTPASINQRNGRGVRQGNKVDSVDVFYYFAAGSFDKYKKQILDNKKNWIDQLLSGTAATGKNADIEAEEEMVAMVTGTLDEYRKKKAEEAQRSADAEKLRLVNQLASLKNTQARLDGLEVRREEAKRKCEDDIEEQHERIERWKRMGKDEGSIQSAEQKLEKLVRKREGIDETYDQEKAKLAAKVNGARGLLREAGKKGQLPFDARLVENPNECIISTRGDVFQVGDVVKRTNGGGGVLFQIREFSTATGNVWLVPVEGVPRRFVAPLEALAASYHKVHIDQTALALKRLRAGSVRYADIRKTGITKEAFLENRGTLCLDRYQCGVFQAPPSEEFHITSLINDDGSKTPVWPEPENPDWRAKVLAAYKNLSGSLAREQAAHSLLIPLLGENFMDELRREKVTEQALIAKMGEIFAEYGDDLTDPYMIKKIKVAIFNRLEKAFDKTSYELPADTRRIFEEFFESREKEALKRKEGEGQDEDVAAPDSVRKKFEAQGFVVRVNEDRVYLNRVAHAPRSRLFLQDPKGMGGFLYRAKEELKRRFGAQYTKNWSAGAGSWWHIPATSNLEDVYAAIFG